MARLLLLRVDYRQYPSYPQGYLTHLFLGFIAAAIGGVALPALLSRHYEAVTFLALAATQFRDIRAMERDSLAALEATELVNRGPAYIEGIAKVFEARNYVAMATALVTGAVFLFVPGSRWAAAAAALVAGSLTVLLLHRAMTGRRVGDYARLELVPLRFEGPFLFAGDALLINVGSQEARQVYLERGLGLVLHPVNADARATLSSPGQRQAIVHDVSAILGVRRDIDEPEYAPIARLDDHSGSIGLAIVPLYRDGQALLEAVSRVPVLEGVRRKPTLTGAGRRAIGGG